MIPLLAWATVADALVVLLGAGGATVMVPVASWIQVANALIVLLGTMFSGIMAYMMARLTQQQRAEEVRAERAARKVEEVRSTLEETTGLVIRRTDDLARVARATHTLVNNAMAIQLRLNMTSTRRLAALTGDPADIEAAEMAGHLYGEHVALQRQVDLQDGTAAQKSGDAGVARADPGAGVPPAGAVEGGPPS